MDRLCARLARYTRFDPRGLLTTLLLLLAVSGCRSTPRRLTPDGAGRVFDKVWTTINRKFYDTDFNGVDWRATRQHYRPQALAATNEAELYRVLHEMLNPLQCRHTRVTPPSAVRRANQERAVNVGTVSLTQAGQPTLVLDVFPGSPAAEAGIRRGWVFVRDWERKSPSQGLIREGETMRAEFLDENDQPRIVEVMARVTSISFPPSIRVLPGGWIYLRFDDFDADASRWLRRQFRQYQHAPGILIDLRFNRGGYRHRLASIGRQLFPAKTELGLFTNRKHGPRSFHCQRRWASKGYDGPLGVLISKNTASCAEILACAIQSHRRGTLFGAGSKTTGAVAASLPWRLPDGGKLSVAVQAYRTPEGYPLEGVGVCPDRTVPTITAADLRSGLDTHVKTALAIMKTEGPSGIMP